MIVETPLTMAINSWVSGVTGRQVAFDHIANVGPRPNRDAWASIILTSQPVGRESTETVTKEPAPPAGEPDLEERVCTLDSVFASISLIDGDGIGDMRRLRQAARSEEWRGVLREGGLGFNSVTASRDLSDTVKETWESRVQADWEFNAASEFVAELFSIDPAQVRVTNEIQGYDTLITQP